MAALAAEIEANLLIVTHHPANARGIASQVIFMAQGVEHALFPIAAVRDRAPAALAAYPGD